MTEDVHVRVGTPEDLEGCMKLFVQANEENGIARLDPEKLLSVVWPSLHQHGGIIGVIGTPGAEPEGVVLLRIESLWYSNAEVLAEKLVYVGQEYRSAKGGRAAKLCEFCKNVSDELGMPLIAGIISNDRTQGKVKMYARRLGPPVGAFYLYNARTGLSDIGRAGDS
jgi:hypothetical protein